MKFPHKTPARGKLDRKGLMQQVDKYSHNFATIRDPKCFSTQERSTAEWYLLQKLYLSIKEPSDTKRRQKAVAEYKRLCIEVYKIDPRPIIDMTQARKWLGEGMILGERMYG